MDAILTFHALDSAGSVISYHPDAFTALLDGLAEEGVRVVSLSALLEPNRDASPRVALTFDDGFRSVHAHALPALAKRKLPALVYVISERVGKTNAWQGQWAGIKEAPLMDWGELTELVAAGINIGAHGKTHCAMLNLSPRELESELTDAKRSLEDRLRTRVEHLAYPYGHFDRETEALASTTYTSAVTTRLAYLVHPMKRHQLPRLDTYYLRDPKSAVPLFGLRTRARLSVRAFFRGLRAFWASQG